MNNDQAFWTGYSWMLRRIDQYGLMDSFLWLKKHCLDCEYDEGSWLALEVADV